MPNRRTFLVLTAALLIAPLRAAADPASDAKQVVETLLGDARSALTGCCPSEALPKAVEQAFDFDIWERFLLQTRAAKLSDAQTGEFRTLLPGFLAHLYTQSFDKGMTAAPTVGGTSRVRNDILVSSIFSRTNGDPLPVDWRLREIGGQMRVIDIMVAGASFLLLKRDEFTAIIDSGGPDALLAHMRDNAI